MMLLMILYAIFALVGAATPFGQPSSSNHLDANISSNPTYKVEDFQVHHEFRRPESRLKHYNTKGEATCILKGIGQRKPYWQPKGAREFFHKRSEVPFRNVIHIIENNATNISTAYTLSNIMKTFNPHWKRFLHIGLRWKVVDIDGGPPEHCRAICETCFDAAEEFGAEEFICHHQIDHGLFRKVKWPQPQPWTCRTSMRIIDHWKTPLDKEAESHWVRRRGKFTSVGDGNVPDLPARVYNEVFGHQETYNAVDDRIRGGDMDILVFPNRPATRMYATEIKCRDTIPCNKPYCVEQDIFAIGTDCYPYNQWTERKGSPFSLLEGLNDQLNLPRWATLYYTGLVPAMNDPGLLLYYHHPKWPNQGIEMAAALDLPWTHFAKGPLTVRGRMDWAMKRYGEWFSDWKKGKIPMLLSGVGVKENWTDIDPFRGTQAAARFVKLTPNVNSKGDRYSFRNWCFNVPMNAYKQCLPDRDLS